MAERTVATGERDKPVTIQALPTPDVDDESGAPDDVDGWATLNPSPVWMSRRDFSGTERFRADQVAAAINSVWEMPYQTTMDPDVVDVPKLRRLLYRGRIYGITAARIVGVNEAIELTTVAGTKV